MSSRSLSPAPNHLFLCSGSFLEKSFSLQFFFSFWYVCTYVCASVCAGVYGRQKHKLDILPRGQVPFFLQGPFCVPLCSAEITDTHSHKQLSTFLDTILWSSFVKDRLSSDWALIFLKKNSLMLLFLIFVSNLISLNTEWEGGVNSLSLYKADSFNFLCSDYKSPASSLVWGPFLT